MTAFSSIEELNQIFLDKGSEIISFVNKNGDDIILDKVPRKTQKVKWRCSNQPEHVSVCTLSSIINKEQYLCISCSRRVYKTVQDMIDLFQTKGSNILAILDENNNELDVTFVPDGRAKIKWTCAENEAHISVSPLKSVTNGDRDRYVCQGCGISKSRGGPTYDSFVKQLEQEGWTMLSNKEEYKNNKSMMKVSCDQGHKSETSQNRFSANHRCARCAYDSKKVSIEVVARAFEEKGFQLISTEYIDNKTPLDYICKCGRQNKMAYSNVTRNRDGCKRCTRRWTILEVQDFVEEQGCDLIDTSTEEFVLNSTGIYYVCVCGTEHFSTWRSFRKGARCPGCTLVKIKETCMKKYGVDNPSKSIEVQKKIVQTMRERYDVDYATQVEEFMKKSIQTNINNHGGVHNLTTPEVRAASVKAYSEKYGDIFGRVKEHQDKARKACMEKYGTPGYIGSNHCKQRMMKEYNQEYFVHSDGFYKKMVKLYDVKHALQNPSILDKMMKNSFRLKDYILPSGNICEVQGYEPYALRDLLVTDIDKRGLTEDDVLTGSKNVPIIEYYTEDGERHKYFPDIFCPSQNLIIEVKSTYTLVLDYKKNKAKFIAAFASGYKFEVWVYDKKGVRDDKIDYVSDILFA